MGTSASVKIFILIMSAFILAGLLIPAASVVSQNHSHVAGNVHGVASQERPIPMQSTADSHVIPSSLYSQEAAPMGIADYGYTPSTGAYSYNSTSFQGTVSLGSLFTYNSSLSSNNNASSFQLNLNLQFRHNGKTFTYWMQDVASASTSSSGKSIHVTFIDNVWNSTSSQASITSGTLSGNGTLGSASGTNGPIYFYYSYAGTSGSSKTLREPSSFSLREKSYVTASGAPAVAMMYNDGNGWAIYDNIVFGFASGHTYNENFVVNGTSTNGAGLFNDAELIMGGPGGGSSTILQSGSLNLSLQYWNGHNFQFIPNAYNYGSDTAETVSSVYSSAVSSSANASLSSGMSHGSGTLGILYTQSEESVLNMSMPFSSGTVKANNATVNFTGSSANLTLPPGVYNISISPSGGGKTLSGSVTLKAGEYMYLSPGSFARKYRVSFDETGLPSGMAWAVTFSNGTSLYSNTSTLVAYLPNGTYRVSVDTGANYSFLPGNLSFTVAGSGMSVPVNFTREYTITFNETGMHGLEWFVTMNGSTVGSTGSSILFNEVNGSFSYSITTPVGYRASPYSGTISVNGSSETVSITINPLLYAVNITESGLPAGFNWTVVINGQNYTGSSTSMVVHLQNGTYRVYAEGMNGSFVNEGNMTITVSGHSTTASIAFRSAYNSGTSLYDKAVFGTAAVAVAAICAAVVRRI